MVSILKTFTLFILLTIVLIGSGIIAGYHWGTGEYPPIFLQIQKSELPPAIVAEDQTFERVTQFVEDDPTDKEVYQEGMNCVDFAVSVVREAHWKGVGSDIVKLTYDDYSAHAVLCFPTVDEGLVFVDPQTDKIIYPERGKVYNGKRIVDMHILQYVWVPIEDYYGFGNATAF